MFSARCLKPNRPRSLPKQLKPRLKQKPLLTQPMLLKPKPMRSVAKSKLQPRPQLKPKAVCLQTPATTFKFFVTQQNGRLIAKSGGFFVAY